jgi:hypothetical protein
MTDARITRAGAIGGIVFVVFGVIAAFLTPAPPSADAKIADIRSFFADHTQGITAAALLTVVSTLGLLVFFAFLRQRIARAEGPNGFLAQLFYGSGLVLIALILLPLFLQAAMTQRVAALPSDDVVRAVFEVGIMSNGAGGIAGGAVLAAVAAAVAMVRILPQWLGWVAWLAAALNLVGGGAALASDTTGLGFLGFVGFLLAAVWVLVVSVLALTGRTGGERAMAPAAA